MSTAPLITARSTNGELNDAALLTRLQALMVGITGYPANRVFPRWQLNPPNQPGATVDWGAIGTLRRSRDVFAANVTLNAITNDDKLGRISIRNEIIECLATFYGPNAESFSEQFAMGLTVPENIRTLFPSIGLVSVDESAVVPDLIKNQWVMRIDVPFRLRRQQVYTYAVPYLNAAAIDIETEFSETIEATVDSGYGIQPFGGPPVSGRGE